MQFHETGLQDAWLIEPEPAHDERGFFARTFCLREFAERSLTARFVQHSLSQTKARGAVRGMHFQRPPHAEVKLVSCAKGAMFDVIIDLRPDSPSYRQWRGFELTPDNRRRLYVPEGFAHGFQTLTDDAETAYLISAFYAPEAASGVRHDDPAFAIDWPLSVTVVSEKDRSWPDFDPS
jgi:dTDP-4-dehydrorhamnose 3,5-epimerase